MKKEFLVVVVSVIAVTGVYSQNQPPNSNSQSANNNNKKGYLSPIAYRLDSSGVKDVREKLVQLALQNPSAEVDDHSVNIAYYNVKKAKTNLWNNIGIQGNLNEYSIKPTTPGSNLYPRYNIGATVPLGLFITRSHDINIARESLNMTIAQRDEHARLLRTNVLSKYEDYLMVTDLLNFQRQVTEDVYTNYLKVEKDFAEARIKVDEYTRAFREYNLELAKQRSLERDRKVVVIELEGYIGTDLETVLKEFK